MKIRMNIKIRLVCDIPHLPKSSNEDTDVFGGVGLWGRSERRSQGMIMAAHMQYDAISLVSR